MQKIDVKLRLSPELWARIDKYRDAQDVKPTKTAVVEKAIELGLDQLEKNQA